MGCHLSDTELLLFHEGNSADIYSLLGCHRVEPDGGALYRFAVWAPNAYNVSVVGDFNGWDSTKNPMTLIGGSGVWEALIGPLKNGDLYQYYIEQANGGGVYKADPFAFFSERRPGTASVVWGLSGFEWNDARYLSEREPTSAAPVCIYEVHAGSWKGDTYRDIADELAPYAREMGFTHIQLLPLFEHTLDSSWGYQAVGCYSATSRYGEPRELMYLVDKCHQEGIGVIMDWGSASFACGEHGLQLFDGTPLFESPHCRETGDSITVPFDLDKPQVRSFLLSNAMFWLGEFHLDGLHISNSSAMLFPARGDGLEGASEAAGENPGAMLFFRELNAAVRHRFPGAMLTAQENSGYHGVTKGTFQNGLGMDYKWNLGYASDILEYMSMEPLHRKWHHDKLTLPIKSALAENHILPLSHLEVVHGKRSLLDKLPGDNNEKFDQLRLLLAFTYAYPGKKLLFMGCEFGQFAQWRYDQELDWPLLDFEMHNKMKRYVAQLNGFYRLTPALFSGCGSWEDFEWLSVNDEIHSVLAFARSASLPEGDDELLACVFNFMPDPHEAYRLGVSEEGVYEAVFNSALEAYGGDVQEYPSHYVSQRVPCNEKRNSLAIWLPPYCAVYLRHVTLTEDEALAE